MQEFSWQYFVRTGDVNAYLLYCAAQFDHEDELTTYEYSETTDKVIMGE